MALLLRQQHRHHIVLHLLVQVDGLHADVALLLIPRLRHRLGLAVVAFDILGVLDRLRGVVLMGDVVGGADGLLVGLLVDDHAAGRAVTVAVTAVT